MNLKLFLLPLAFLLSNCSVDFSPKGEHSSPANLENLHCKNPVTLSPSASPSDSRAQFSNCRVSTDGRLEISFAIETELLATNSSRLFDRFDVVLSVPENVTARQGQLVLFQSERSGNLGNWKPIKFNTSEGTIDEGFAFDLGSAIQLGSSGSSQTFALANALEAAQIDASQPAIFIFKDAGDKTLWHSNTLLNLKKPDQFWNYEPDFLLETDWTFVHEAYRLLLPQISPSAVHLRRTREAYEQINEERFKINEHFQFEAGSFSTAVEFKRLPLAPAVRADLPTTLTIKSETGQTEEYSLSLYTVRDDSKFINGTETFGYKMEGPVEIARGTLAAGSQITQVGLPESLKETLPGVQERFPGYWTPIGGDGRWILVLRLHGKDIVIGVVNAASGPGGGGRQGGSFPI